jgi:hypothetical protein
MTSRSGTISLSGRCDFFEQPRGVQLLEPLRIAHIGLLAGHAFDGARIDQPDVDAGFLQHVVDGDPVVARRLDGDGLDVAGEQPVAQGVDAAGEGREGAHGLRRAIGGNRGDDLGAADVDAAGVGVRVWVEDGLAGLGGAGAFFTLALAFAHCREGSGLL